MNKIVICFTEVVHMRNTSAPARNVTSAFKDTLMMVEWSGIIANYSMDSPRVAVGGHVYYLRKADNNLFI